MSNPLNQIHLTNTTKISLNDRFTVMQRLGGGGAPQTTSPNAGGGGGAGRGRRSQSAGREISAASLRNQRLAQALNAKHGAPQLNAGGLQRNNLKTNMRAKQRLNNRTPISRAARQNILQMNNRPPTRGKLTRSNSLSNIATMKADQVSPRRLNRSNSQTNLANRLGVRGGGNNARPNNRRSSSATRRPLVRSNSKTNLRQRSNSRQNLSRANSQTRTNLTRRANSKQNLAPVRANSRTRLNRRSAPGAGGSAAAVAATAGQFRGQRRRLPAAAVQRGQLKGRNSIGNRLGGNGVRRSVRSSATGGAQPQQTNQRVRGRSATRGNGRGGVRAASQGRAASAGRNKVAAGRVTKQNRRGRSTTRAAPVNVVPAKRGRSRSRSKGPAARKANTQKPGGRRVRGKSTNSKVTVKVEHPKSREDLDKELEQYMANTKSHLDRDMDVYMKDGSF